MTMLDATTDLRTQTDRIFRRKQITGFAVPAVILAYLTYIFFAFDVGGLAERARMDNAATLVADSYSY